MYTERGILAYFDLEHNDRHHGAGTGTGTETAALSMESSRAPLSVQYSEEPQAAGPSPALPQRERRKDTETESLGTELESDVNSTTIFGTRPLNYTWSSYGAVLATG